MEGTLIWSHTLTSVSGCKRTRHTPHVRLQHPHIRRPPGCGHQPITVRRGRCLKMGRRGCAGTPPRQRGHPEGASRHPRRLQRNRPEAHHGRRRTPVQRRIGDAAAQRKRPAYKERGQMLAHLPSLRRQESVGARPPPQSGGVVLGVRFPAVATTVATAGRTPPPAVRPAAVTAPSGCHPPRSD